MGMMMLAAVLEQAGYAVRLLDANAIRRPRTTDEIVQAAEEFRPAVIGMTLVTPLVKEAYRLAAALRGCGAKLLAGGPHATLLPDEPLEHGFDAVVAGEGEPTIVEAVEALLGRLPAEPVQGLVYRAADGTIRVNEPRPPVADLDSLPPPARHLVPADRLRPRRRRSALLDLHLARLPGALRVLLRRAVRQEVPLPLGR